MLDRLEHQIHRWIIEPAGTEGYEKAEVTGGGIDTAELSGKTMESQKVPGLFFIGEVVDVTGHLGGLGKLPVGVVFRRGSRTGTLNPKSTFPVRTLVHTAPKFRPNRQSRCASYNRLLLADSRVRKSCGTCGRCLQVRYKGCARGRLGLRPASIGELSTCERVFRKISGDVS